MNGISALSLFYFTVVLKIEPALAGLLIFAARIYDAVTDPLSGWLSDRSKSKLGRLRPFLLAGAFVWERDGFVDPVACASAGDGRFMVADASGVVRASRSM